VLIAFRGLALCWLFELPMLGLLDMSKNSSLAGGAMRAMLLGLGDFLKMAAVQ
jgi:hypothetical protein